MILYSIICPVYNTGNFLQRCVESVLKQTYQNWELILVDDGSTDQKTIDLCDDFAQKDDRIQVFHKPNEGLLLTRRFGMKQSKGEYLYALDSDDYLHPKMLEKVNKIIQRTNSDLVMFRYQRKGTTLNRKVPKLFANRTVFDSTNKKKLYKSFFETSYLNHMWTKVVQREIAGLEIDFSKFSNITYGEDRLQSASIIKKAKRAVYISDVLYYYVNNPASITHGRRTLQHYLKITKGFQIINQYIETLFSRQEMNEYEAMIAKRTFDLCFRDIDECLKSKEISGQEKIQFLEYVQNESVMQRYKNVDFEKKLSRKEKQLWNAYKMGALKEYYKCELV